MLMFVSQNMKFKTNVNIFNSNTLRYLELFDNRSIGGAEVSRTVLPTES